MRRLLIACLLLMPLAYSPAFAAAKTEQEALRDEVIYRVSLGKADDVRMLVERLGDANTTDNMGWPLLAIAASRTDAEAYDVVKTLVEMGGDVNYHGGRMNYPLMFAVQSNNAKIVKFLLDNGANYRVTDPYGMRVVDFARQSNNPEVIKLIEDAVNDDVMHLSGIRSQEYLDEITYNLAYNACAYQYYTYYYASKQDAIPLAQQKKKLETFREPMGKSIGELVTLFRVSKTDTDEIFHDARQVIFNELEKMVSNRWRRTQGVGKQGDMEERCTRLTKKWKKGIFNKDLLDQRTSAPR